MPLIKCRYCNRELKYERLSDLPCFPFCSKRCKMADLSLWFDGKHRIEGEESIEQRNLSPEGDNEQPETA